MRPSSFFRIGAQVARDVVLRLGLIAVLRLTVPEFRSEGRAPASARRADSSGAVSSGPIRRFPLRKDVAGIEARVDSHGGYAGRRYPRAIDHWIGAAPRNSGSSEACTLMMPSGAISMTLCGMICP